MFFFTNRIDVNDEKQANEMEEEKRLVLEKNEWMKQFAMKVDCILQLEVVCMIHVADPREKW